MNISNTGIELITTFEGYQDSAYPDIANVWTIGYGTTRVNGQPVTKGMTCTKEQAIAWLTSDIKYFEQKIMELCHSSLTQYQFDALVCLVYNIGDGNFSTSTILKYINDPKLGPSAVGENNFTAWNKVRSNGVLVPSVGLTRRRKSEYHLFSTGTLKVF